MPDSQLLAQVGLNSGHPLSASQVITGVKQTLSLELFLTSVEAETNLVCYDGRLNSHLSRDEPEVGSGLVSVWRTGFYSWGLEFS